MRVVGAIEDGAKIGEAGFIIRPRHNFDEVGGSLLFALSYLKGKTIARRRIVNCER